MIIFYLIKVAHLNIIIMCIATNAMGLLLIAATIISASLALLGGLPLDTSWSAASEWRLEAEVNVLLGIQTDNERWNVANLLHDANVSLPYEDACVVDGLGESELEHLSLQTALQEVLNLETKNVIELHLALVQDSNPDQTSEKSITFEQSLGILLLQSEQNSSSGSDLGQAVLDSPDLSLVPETILSNELQLLVKTSLLKRSPRSGVRLRVHLGYSAINHLDDKSLLLL